MKISRPQFPQPKPVMVIADYPVSTEPDSGVIFSAPSHITLLDRLTSIAKIDPTTIYTTYLSYYRPSKEDFEYRDSIFKRTEFHTNSKEIPFGKDSCSEKFFLEIEGLWREIEKVSPKLIIIVGKFTLFILTDKASLSNTQGTYKNLKPLGGLDSYRGSQILLRDEIVNKLNLPEQVLLFPLLPLTIEFKQPKKGVIMTMDIKKLGEIYKNLLKGKWKIPDWKLEHSPDYSEIIDNLNRLIVKCHKKKTLISVDIETLAYTIDRISFTDNLESAFSIVFGTRQTPNIFTEDEESFIVFTIRNLLLHPNCQIIGQNWAYDDQYIRKFWLCPTFAYHDCMIAQHVKYNFMQKSLDYLASIYCNYYEQWKDLQDHTEEK